MLSASDTRFTLYTFFRSTSSARVRTVARLRGIPVRFEYVSIRQSEHKTAQYESINPNLTVPTLLVTAGGNEVWIRQSVAIMEFLEETNAGREDVHLMPPTEDTVARAHVRELVQLVACDIQPPTNQRILKKVHAMGGVVETWAHDIMSDGLKAFESLVAPLAGTYCYGDSVTLADVVLVPAIENAIRYGVDLGQFPIVKRVYEKAKDLEAFRLADWKHQADTPPEFRADA